MSTEKERRQGTGTRTPKPMRRGAGVAWRSLLLAEDEAEGCPRASCMPQVPPEGLLCAERQG